MTQSVLPAHNDYGSHLNDGRIATMRAAGAWHDRVLTDFFDCNVAMHPDATAIAAWSGESGMIAIPRVFIVRGTDRFSFTRASAVVNCQSALTCLRLRVSSRRRPPR